jgi:NAD(P)-dependent dehydrogenase (short-subunit alcohol dehydrogenase family)
MTSLSPAVNKLAYGLSKNGLNYLVKTFVKENKKNNISANAIAPLVLDTPANREWVEDLSITVKPEDVGELIYAIFENSRIISGNIIELPGTLN